ncbi:MAG TPA: asparagine synthase (glutamine-hydrolyzing) [Pyrinomonadaceae bacterium]|nr:asparagine synthase (glutamine-hydrolyzing) [Pyrinomonadaceae bacterium]
MTGSADIAAQEVLSRMVTHLLHRGPNDQDTTYLRRDSYALALGHTRLSIIDLSASGRQPMTDPLTGNIIVFNGEIYNFKELRNRLNDQYADWHTQTDTEVILKAYRRWGIECVQRLRGMFAFALWDATQERLFIARDRLGIKPLYYYSAPGRVIFASEVRAILASELTTRQIDPIGLNEFLAYQAIPAPRTLIKGIKALPPGTWMKIDTTGVCEEHKYWDLLRDFSTEARGVSELAILRRVGELLREATELHMVSDVPLGAFLSGGIDSSAIVALIRELGYTPRTFSVIFADRKYDESIYARQVARRFRTEHKEIRLTESAMLDQLPEALAAMDQPTGDGVNTYVVSEAVKNAGITVALSGLGGDEFFVGYPSFLRLEKVMKCLRLMNYLPVTARGAAARLIEFAGGKSIQATKAAAMIRGDGSLASVYPVLRQLLSSSQREVVLSRRWRQLAEVSWDPYVDILQTAFQNTTVAQLFARISYAEGRTYMHDVLLRDTDQMSMAHAIEVRVPLLDHKLVEYLMGVPDIYKRPNGTPKPLLVASLGDLLPRDVVHRPKQGFTLPFANWMKGNLRKYCQDRLHSDRVENRGIFDATEITRLWKCFLAGSSEVSWSRLWVLVVLEEWLERNRVQCSI